MNNPFLIGERLYLRALEVEDAARCAAWLNHPAVRVHLAHETPLSRCAEEQFLRGLGERPGSNQSQERVLLIVLREQDRPIGLVGLHPKKCARAREVGILLGEQDCWDQGYGREAMSLLLDHAFLDLDVHRVELFVHAENPRAIACYERLGFVREGVLREAHFREGRFGDDVVMSVLGPEWRARRQHR